MAEKRLTTKKARIATPIVIPHLMRDLESWIPAFAGMTEKKRKEQNIFGYFNTR